VPKLVQVLKFGRDRKPITETGEKPDEIIFVRYTNPVTDADVQAAGTELEASVPPEGDFGFLFSFQCSKNMPFDWVSIKIAMRFLKNPRLKKKALTGNIILIYALKLAVEKPLGIKLPVFESEEVAIAYLLDPARK
jgi:hypothetical protein